MFVMMYYKSKSLIVCIVAHGVFNAISVFANEASATTETRIISAIWLTVITGSYALYLALSIKRKMKFTERKLLRKMEKQRKN
jgi:membrane protease YdiL (CAAX protease family)